MSAYISSYLFLVPALWGFLLLPYKDVSFACILCAITSTNNHMNECQDKTKQKIDQIVVRTVATFYTLHSLYTMHFRPLTIPMYFLGALSTMLYIYTDKLEDGYKYHYLIHVFSNLGIMFYICARYTYLNY